MFISSSSDMASHTGCLILTLIFLMEMVSPSISKVASSEQEKSTYKFSLEAEDFDKELAEISLGEFIEALQEIILLLQPELNAIFEKSTSIPRFRKANEGEKAIRCVSKLFNLIKGIISTLFPK
ncbi:uncharacterized protein LOC123317525 [Coccinella septempunctata]|uniref:uncharacterized protein LOC123317525 n=1 Tax=Coccinella septempunctata TaxID=41139 RepID=UPI001D066432|nr:uncharacterized protein LOC123317525 [Coccinella septempunctata]